MSPVWSPNKRTKRGMAFVKLSKTQNNFDFESQKTKWYWSHSSTVRESLTKNLFHQVRQLIRNTMWKYCLVCFKEFVGKTSVSGKRKLVPLAWQRETSHCGINKAVFGRTRHSRIKSYPIVYWFILRRHFLIPQNQIHAERKKIWRHGEH
jgi:hypothetical protein